MEEKNKDLALTTSKNCGQGATDIDKSETYNVEIADCNNKVESKATKKQSGGILVLLSMIFAFVSLACALVNLLFAILTVVATLLLEILPFIHAFLCIPALIPSILAIIFACIAKKKGNNTVKVKLGLIFGIARSY